ncbi:hypothetical protein GNP80_06455 [Aliivibrio fischeri]|uniref:hypothetical protein n=1 Tax=Aliivibrio fischeri TaxID=668 RepID=UPI0012D8D4C8|nr:hypothetical protein [Aliivibrio fischeri]MUK92080.1 hypothetical protein [Aliivibrio fischeri]
MLKSKMFILLFLVLKSDFVCAKVPSYEINPITRSEFERKFQALNPYIQPKITSIKELDTTRDLLSEVLFLDDENFEIKDKNGNSLVKEDELEAMHEFIAYYPDENSIYLKDWMGMDKFISLETGIDRKENPKSRIYSPNNNHKISVYYNGGDSYWSVYRIINKQWIKMNERIVGESVFYSIDQFYWLNDNEFIFTNLYRENQFYQGILLK